MRMLICGACAVIAVGLMAVSATLSWRFSYSLGGSLLESHAYAAAAAGLDILKGFLPFLITLRLGEGRRLAASAGFAVFVLGVIWSFTSAMGLAAQVHMAKANTIDNRQAAYREALALLARIETEQARITRRRSTAEISSEIETQLAATIRVGSQFKTVGLHSDHCARPQRAPVGCETVLRLRQELAAATEWQRLDAEANRVRARIGDLRQSGAGAYASLDAQAETIARALAVMTGREVSPDYVRLSLLILLGLLLEAGSSCGLYVALGSHAVPGGALKPGRSQQVPPADQIGAVAQFARDRLQRREGARLSMGQAHVAYNGWCEAEGVTAMPRAEFLRAFRREGERDGWSVAGGVVHHVELSLACRPRDGAEA